MLYPAHEEITPEFVMALTAPCSSFLCPISANIYNIEFTAFKIRDVDSGANIFEVRKEPGSYEPPEEGDDSSRSIRYHFGPAFLDLQAIGTEIEFSVGEYPVHDFMMIERHYFKDMLIKSYDFLNPFCMPNSTNTWEVCYSMPELAPEWRQELMNNPWESRSDTFYFIGGRLIMHNRAEYSYS
jgi:hypothetical protein